jgi:hypothetical protein
VSILTVAELREHVTSALPDAALQRLLDAAEDAIVERVGAPGAITEYVSAWASGAGYAPWGLTTGMRRITVSRPIGTIASVTEYLSAGAVGDPGIILDATDYRASGYVLARLPGGTHSRWYWGQQVAVVYTPADETADRTRVQIALVRLDLNAEPGLAQQITEGFAERFSGAGLLNYSEERADLLASLGSAVAGGMGVVDDRR